MRILFFCGSLEPGRDGVGDYTRALARACFQQGHECRIVALNDMHVLERKESDDVVAGSRLVSLRLPSIMAWEERVRLAADFRSRFQPDWQSLQLVCYGLQRKGILWNVNRHLKLLLAGCPLHIMVHEVWIGLSPHSPLKHRVTGVIQRLCLQRLCAMVRPDVVTTSNPLYRVLLQQIGVTSTVLPLLNNIPIVQGNTDYPQSLSAAGIKPADRGEWWFGLFFGELYPEWKPEPFLTIARASAQKAGRKLAFISLGRSGLFGPGIWQRLQRDYPGITFVTMGEQSFETVSAVMQLCDFGVPTSALQLIGKSGSAAAMLEHGLPVIVTRTDPQFRFAFSGPSTSDPMVFPCDDTLEAKMSAGLPRNPPEPRAAHIAARFCELLAGSASDAPRAC